MRRSIVYCVLTLAVGVGASPAWADDKADVAGHEHVGGLPGQGNVRRAR
jgi:hypothetical protein